MGADADNLLAKLQLQLSQQQNQGPNLYGLTAATDPNQTAGILAKLQNQNYVNQQGNANPNDLFSIVANAGKKDFARLGQNIANMTGIGTPPQYDNSATMQQRQTIQSANAGVSQDVANGVDPIQAKINALTKAAQAGVPGAADLLDKAVSDQKAGQKTDSEITKNNAQGAAANASVANQADEQKNRAFQQGSGTWQTMYTDPNGLFMLQKNANGEVKRVELKPPPSAAAQAAANVDPNSIQFAADTYRTTGKFPGSFGRNPALQALVLKQVAQDAAANGDTPGAIQARTDSLKAGSNALSQITKQEAFTGSAVSTLDKNLQALQTIGSKLDDAGSPLINKVLNHFNQGVVSDKDTASYVAMLNAVQGEYAKIASNNNGNSPVSDSAKADAKEVINKAMSQGGIQGVRDAMMQESNNRMQAIREARQNYVAQLGANAPGVNQPQGRQSPSTSSSNGTPPAAAPAPRAPLPTTNQQGWTLHRDANGNQAYVSPDGRQFQQVGAQ